MNKKKDDTSSQYVIIDAHNTRYQYLNFEKTIKFKKILHA